MSKGREHKEDRGDVGLITSTTGRKRLSFIAYRWRKTDMKNWCQRLWSSIFWSWPRQGKASGNQKKISERKHQGMSYTRHMGRGPSHVFTDQDIALQSRPAASPAAGLAQRSTDLMMIRVRMLRVYGRQRRWSYVVYIESMRRNRLGLGLGGGVRKDALATYQLIAV